MNIYLVLRIAGNRVRSITATADLAFAKSHAKSLADSLVQTSEQLKPPSDADMAENLAFAESMGWPVQSQATDDLAKEYAESQVQLCTISLGFKRKNETAKGFFVWLASFFNPQWDVVIIGAQE